MVSFPHMLGSAKSETYGAGYDTEILVGGSDTKGSYVELVPSIPPNVTGIQIVFGYRGNDGDMLLDLAVGDAGSEVNIINNLLYSKTAVRLGDTLYLPLRLPASERLSMRAQGSTGTEDVFVTVILFRGGLQDGFCKVDTYGANTADSGGVGLTANSEGSESYSEIISSLPHSYRSFLAVVGNQDDFVSNTSQRYNVDIAIGSSGQEIIVARDLYVVLHTTPRSRLPVFFYHPIPLPKGERLAAKVTSDAGSNSDGIMDIAIYGFR